MKGVVLAGGTGSRLRPLTYTMPKQMIPIAGRPVLEYAITDLRDAGVTEIAIVLGEHGHEEIKSHFGDGTEFGVDITYIYQGEPLGLGHAVGCAKEFVNGDSFVLFLGDDLLQTGISSFVSQFDADEYGGAIAVKPVDNPSRYGIVKLDEDSDIVGMVEKPNDPPTDLAGIGVFILTPAIFEEIEKIEPSWRGEVELSDAIHRLLSQGQRFQSYVTDGWWFDVGTPEDVIAANRAVLEDLTPENDGDRSLESVVGRVAIGNETEISPEATVRGPVYLGDNVTVASGSYVGPFSSIGDGCTIDGAAIESSVVLEGAQVTTEARIVDSLVGKSASIGESTGRPDGARFVVGTDCEVNL